MLCIAFYSRSVEISINIPLTYKIIGGVTYLLGGGRIRIGSDLQEENPATITSDKKMSNA